MAFLKDTNKISPFNDGEFPVSIAFSVSPFLHRAIADGRVGDDIRGAFPRAVAFDFKRAARIARNDNGIMAGQRVAISKRLFDCLLEHHVRNPIFFAFHDNIGLFLRVITEDDDVR